MTKDGTSGAPGDVAAAAQALECLATGASADGNASGRDR
jgi:hypothetical protein